MHQKLFCLTSFGGDTSVASHIAATRRPYFGCDLKQKEAQSACEESTHKGVNQRSKDVTHKHNRDLTMP